MSEYEVIEASGGPDDVHREILEWSAEMMERAIAGPAIGPLEPGGSQFPGAAVYAQILRGHRRKT